jgi:hypothetical protein
MSFLKKLFGGGSKPAPAPEAAPAIEHAGFLIKATPYEERGEWQMCGVIEKEIDGALKSHRFIRADRFAARELAVEMTQAKARLIIDQQGDRLFG